MSTIQSPYSTYGASGATALKLAPHGWNTLSFRECSPMVPMGARAEKVQRSRR